MLEISEKMKGEAWLINGGKEKFGLENEESNFWVFLSFL